jgi:hypothetical protein
VKGNALRRLWADARQAAELINEILNRSAVHAG